MKIGTRILKPRRWKEDFLTHALIGEGIPKEYILTNMESDVEILVSNFLSVEELNRLKKLNCLIIPTGGIDGICIKDVLDKRIKIYHDPSITSRGVAKYTADKLEYLLGNEVVDFMGAAKVGLLGFGNVGGQVYEALKNYECNFEAFTRKTNPPISVKSRKGNDDLDALLSESDIIINTLPLTSETDRLLYGKTAQMKIGAVVVSVSRSGILDDRVVLERVHKGSLRGAILDVYSEDITANDYEHKSIILTPHIAGIYGEALYNVARFVKNSIQDALVG